MSNVIFLPDPKCTNPKGEVIVYPCEDRGGSWAVDHWSRSGDSGTRLGTWLGCDEAYAAAARFAREIECDFPQGRRK